jgi:hypothetical protein
VYPDAIQSAVLKVRSAAVFFGPDGSGRWQVLEIRSFMERCVMSGIPVIPVLLPGLREVPQQLPFMRELHHVTFKHTVFEESPMRQLLWGITGINPEHRQQRRAPKRREL